MTSPRGLDRKEFSAKTKGEALKRAMRDGVPHCEKCGVRLTAATGIVFEHIIPDGLGGDNSLANCGCWCFTCADIKTHTEDSPRMAKADRIFKKHHGLKPRVQKIQSRGFEKRPKQHTATRPINRGER